MKVEKLDGTKERLVVTGMVVDPTVLGRLAAKWDRKHGQFRSAWANLVGQWCVDYYDRYGKAPGKNVEGLFAAWAERSKDRSTVRLVEKYLEGLSGEYARRRRDLNPEYVANVAGDLWNEVRLDRMITTLQGFKDAGRLDDAFKKLDKFDRIQVGKDEIIDVLQDASLVERTFARRQEPPLVEYPGAAGRFFGRAFRRGAFVSFMGPEKRGKSYWLMDVAWRAMLQRKKVLYFSIGDMTAEEMMERWYPRAASAPIEPGTVRLPRSITKSDDGFSVEFEEKKFRRGLDPGKAKAAFRKVMMEKVRSKDPFLKLSVYANDSAGMAEVRADVQRLERRGWLPDMVVIDYADLLVPPAGFAESRDATNSSWKKMRGLSQEYNICVVTATQSKATSYTADTLDMSMFADDKRKFAHVTAMIGLNQNSTEKEKDVMRLNFLVLREDRFAVRRFCHCAMNLSFANPCVFSA